MLNSVVINITGHITGTSFVCPYSHTLGLAKYPGTDSAVIYRVPKYQLRIDGGGSYDAIRFALHNDGKFPPPKTRGCDSGLAHARTCVPGWIPNYSPHSFVGGIRRGAWQLLSHRGFLIHEGADSNAGQVGGSIGCIEILDGKWNGFLSEIERIGKGSCSELSRHGRVTVKIQGAAYPTAELFVL